MKRQQNNACLLLAGIFMALMSGGALAQTPGIDELVAREQWREAALTAFSRAEDTEPRTLELPGSRAQVGFATEAIEAEMRLKPAPRAWAYIEISRHAPDMAAEGRMALLKRAEEAAQLSAVQRLELPRISLRYLQLGDEAEARRVHEQALQLADANPGEYRNLAETYELERDLPIKPWLTEPLAGRLGNMPDAFHAAFTYRALSQLQRRSGNAQAARESLVRGFQVARSIKSGRRDTALRALGETAIETGELDLARRYGNETMLARAYAMHAAHSGDYDKALEMISGFNANLYVDHRTSTIGAITREALEHKDLPTARRFLAELPEWDWHSRARGLTGIGRIERERGNLLEALKAYDAALAPYLGAPGYSIISDYDIAALTDLAEALLAMGDTARARKVSDRLDGLIASIQPTRHKEIIRAESLAAELCGKLHDFHCASLRILSAYNTLQRVLAADAAKSAGNPKSSQAQQWTVIGTSLGSIGLSAAALSASR